MYFRKVTVFRNQSSTKDLRFALEALGINISYLAAISCVIYRYMILSIEESFSSIVSNWLFRSDTRVSKSASPFLSQLISIVETSLISTDFAW